MLLDTCVFLWLAGRSPRLSILAAATINDPANVLNIRLVARAEILVPLTEAVLGQCDCGKDSKISGYRLRSASPSVRA